MRRSGTILIIVAGICALLASLTLAFIVRSRASIEETAASEANMQARIMLLAACSYVCEASRIGYEPLGNSANGTHLETFGWIDVRDGSTGPNTRDYSNYTSPTDIGSSIVVPLPTGTPVPTGNGTRPAWPAIGSVARCPMYVMKRPPFALQLKAVYNPVATSGPDMGTPYLKNRDPEPQSKIGYASDLINGGSALGRDPTPVQTSMGRSWFRVYRDGPATFVITVGAGGTMGWRDFREANANGAAAEFNNEPQFFETVLAQEVRMWYRIEWSPAVEPPEGHNIGGNILYESWANSGLFPMYPINNSDSIVISPDSRDALGSQSHPCNHGGTIRWVQRLRSPPKLW
jgi:type II secretory pathway pseudopilin PulG